MQTKKEKASALAVTVIIMGLVLTIALGASLTSILERKASLSSGDSNTAYQKADAGVEKILKRIKDNNRGMVDDIDSDCDGIIDDGEGYKIELKDEDGEIINTDNGYTCSSEDIASIKWLKSIGTADQNQRVIEVAVAAGEEVYETACNYDNSDQSGRLMCCRMKIDDGTADCQYARSEESFNDWASVGSPWSSASSGTFRLSCGLINDEPIPGGIAAVCCRTDVSSGSVDCQKSNGLNGTWSSITSPWN